MTSSRDVPDLIGTDPVVGYRIWHLARFAATPELHSVVYGGPWPARRRLEARCNKHRWRSPDGRAAPFLTSAHTAPAPQRWCTCGIHVGARPENALAHRSGYDTLVVRGQASLWGRLIRCERGWRGLYAYPYALEIEPNTVGVKDPGELRELAARITERYGVECAVGK